MRIRSFLGIALCTSLAAACGGGSGDDTADDDDTVRPDANVVVDPPDAAPQNVCTFADDFGAATFVQQSATGMAGTGGVTDPDQIEFDGVLNADAAPDAVAMLFYKGYGSFPTSITPGTYEITGDELEFATCGICPILLGDVDTTSGAPSQFYYATGGSVTITSINPNITGSYSNLTFEEVTGLDTGTSDTVPGGCTTQSVSGSFDVAVTYQ